MGVLGTFSAARHALPPSRLLFNHSPVYRHRCRSRCQYLCQSSRRNPAGGNCRSGGVLVRWLSTYRNSRSTIRARTLATCDEWDKYNYWPEPTVLPNNATLISLPTLPPPPVPRPLLSESPMGGASGASTVAAHLVADKHPQRVAGD